MKRVTVMSEVREEKEYLNNLIDTLKGAGNIVVHHEVEKMDINFCQGCFRCWVKTPGECCFKDDMELIYRDYVNSEIVIHAGDVKVGYISSGLKKAAERLIPVMHPYMVLDDGEIHHLGRYDSYPDLGLILTGDKVNAEEREIISDMYMRAAKNAKGVLKFVKTSDEPYKELGYEISNY